MTKISCNDPIPYKTKEILSIYGISDKKDSIENGSKQLYKKDYDTYDFVAGLTNNEIYVDDPIELSIGHLLSDKKATATTPHAIQLFQCINKNPKNAFLHSILLLRSLMRQNSDDMPRLKKEEQKYMQYGGISQAEADEYCQQRVTEEVNNMIKVLSKEPGNSMPKLLEKDKQLIIDYLLLKVDLETVVERAEEWIKNAKAKEYKVLTKEKGQLVAFHNLFIKMTSNIESGTLSITILSGIQQPMDNN